MSPLDPSLPAGYLVRDIRREDLDRAAALVAAAGLPAVSVLLGRLSPLAAPPPFPKLSRGQSWRTRCGGEELIVSANWDGYGSSDAASGRTYMPGGRHVSYPLSPERSPHDLVELLSSP